jgi:hypothetical protein
MRCLSLTLMRDPAPSHLSPSERLECVRCGNTGRRTMRPCRTASAAQPSVQLPTGSSGRRRYRGRRAKCKVARPDKIESDFSFPGEMMLPIFLNCCASATAKSVPACYTDDGTITGERKRGCHACSRRDRRPSTRVGHRRLVDAARWLDLGRVAGILSLRPAASARRHGQTASSVAR